MKFVKYLELKVYQKIYLNVKCAAKQKKVENHLLKYWVYF